MFGQRLKFTDQDYAFRTHEEDFIVMVVEDSGCGIPKQ